MDLAIWTYTDGIQLCVCFRKHSIKCAQREQHEKGLCLPSWIHPTGLSQVWVGLVAAPLTTSRWSTTPESFLCWGCGTLSCWLHCNDMVPCRGQKGPEWVKSRFLMCLSCRAHTALKLRTVINQSINHWIIPIIKTSHVSRDKKSEVEGILGVILSPVEAVDVTTPRLSRLLAGFWWTAIYHLEVKGRPNCPAYSMSGTSPGRCLWDATTPLTEQQQVIDAEWEFYGQCLLSYSKSSMDGLVPVHSSIGQDSGLQPAKHWLMLK